MNIIDRADYNKEMIALYTGITVRAMRKGVESRRLAQIIELEYNVIYSCAPCGTIGKYLRTILDCANTPGIWGRGIVIDRIERSCMAIEAAGRDRIPKEENDGFYHPEDMADDYIKELIESTVVNDLVIE